MSRWLILLQQIVLFSWPCANVFKFKTSLWNLIMFFEHWSCFRLVWSLYIPIELSFYWGDNFISSFGCCPVGWWGTQVIADASLYPQWQEPVTPTSTGGGLVNLYVLYILHTLTMMIIPGSRSAYRHRVWLTSQVHNHLWVSSKLKNSILILKQLTWLGDLSSRNKI